MLANVPFFQYFRVILHVFTLDVPRGTKTLSSYEQPHS